MCTPQIRILLLTIVIMVCVWVCVCVCVCVCLCIPKKISIAKDRKCNSFEHRAVDLKMNDSDLLYKKF